MSNKWVVVGISGATCSGKTTLVNNLHKIFPQSIVINQDDYFFPVDSPNHVKVESLGHLNWEIMSALDMESMKADVSNILAQEPCSAVLPNKAKRLAGGTQKSSMQECYPFLLLLEGFLLLNDDNISDLCDLRIYLTLTKEQCWNRRSVRIYDPPDIPGYFDQVVWPEYVKHRDKVIQKNNLKVVDGMNSEESILEDVCQDISIVISNKLTV